MKDKKLVQRIPLLLMLVLVCSLLLVSPHTKAAAQKPEITSIKVTGGAATITWEETDKAESYTIYRSGVKLATVKSTQTSYKDTGIKVKSTYKYYVAAKLTTGKTQKGSEVSITIKSIGTPVIVSVTSSEDGSTDKAVLKWKAVEGASYQILRKSGTDPYKTIKSVKAASTSGKYTDKGLKQNKNYTYTVRRVITSGVTKQYSDYDTAGITTMAKAPANLSASFRNLSAGVYWDKVAGASKYIIYRRFNSGSFTQVKSVSADTTVWTDVYHDTFTSGQRTKYLGAEGYFIDCSENPIAYTVRAVKTSKVTIGTKSYTKTSFGKYDTTGYFNLSMPVVSKVTTPKDGAAQITFARVPFAEKYIIYDGQKSDGSLVWHKLATVKQSSDRVITADIKGLSDERTYYTVRAVATRGGKTIKSDFETGFTKNNRKYGSANILFIGDSITVGVPYTSSADGVKNIFSFPYRVAQLTGVSYYKAAISGATVAVSPEVPNSILTMTTQVSKGQTPTSTNSTLSDLEGQNLADFDVIVFAAGTNDYSHNVKIGSTSSTSNKDFCGALNKRMGLIADASKARVSAGKKPTRLVYCDIWYSERTGTLNKPKNRDAYPNGINLTLADYQKAMVSVINKYKTKMDLYQFDTRNTSYGVYESNSAVLSYDSVHYTKIAYARIGQGLTDYLISKKILK
ncbi:MAG: SGNH/GDSL hydrolase family protein [Lachnospiraceae bacterium]|nr:SGNH/GDSL hydrolase family protein [Lachnospiraceae bacterium]